MNPYEIAAEPDLEAIFEISAVAFATSVEDVTKWLGVGGHENLRVVREGEAVAASVLEIPMGQFWLGRSVPTIGIAGVGCALECRGRGHTRRLMDGHIQSAAERDIPTSTLFPATQTLYRRSGYERAGIAKRASIPLSSLVKRAYPPGVSVRRLAREDEPAAWALYAELAQAQHGHLDRGPYVQQRILAPRGKPTRGFGFYFDEVLEGYLYFKQNHDDPASMNHNVWLTDVCAKTPRAHDAVWRFLFETRSTADNVGFYAPTYSTLLSSLEEAYYEEERFADWMLRICRADLALAGRGYPRSAQGSVELTLEDPLVEANRGHFVLEVGSGRGELRRRNGSATGGSVSLGIGPLASLYSGFLSATQLARLGWLNGTAEQVTLLDELFASPLPSLVDMF